MSGVPMLPAGVPSCSLGGCGRVVSGPGMDRLLAAGSLGEGGMARPRRIGPLEPLPLLLPGTGGRRRGAGEDSWRESDPDMVGVWCHWVGTFGGALSLLVCHQRYDKSSIPVWIFLLLAIFPS